VASSATSAEVAATSSTVADMSFISVATVSSRSRWSSVPALIDWTVSETSAVAPSISSALAVSVSIDSATSSANRWTSPIVDSNSATTSLSVSPISRIPSWSLSGSTRTVKSPSANAAIPSR
jgi:hypothetical protein